MSFLVVGGGVAICELIFFLLILIYKPKMWMLMKWKICIIGLRLSFKFLGFWTPSCLTRHIVFVTIYWKRVSLASIINSSACAISWNLAINVSFSPYFSWGVFIYNLKGSNLEAYEMRRMSSSLYKQKYSSGVGGGKVETKFVAWSTKFTRIIF